MSSIIYAIKASDAEGKDLLKLWSIINGDSYIKPKELWAIKLHFGETGSNGFIRPNLVSFLAKQIAFNKAFPFVTDTNTLYVGGRTNAANHLEVAAANGFTSLVLGAPVVIADGLRGKNQVEIQVDLEEIKTAYIAGDIYEANGLLALTHFKGHELAGFGGALKNIAMGGASRQGKLDQHCDLGPKVKRAKCVGCGDCLRQCAHQAIKFVDKKAQIISDKCVGCSACVAACPENAIKIRFSDDSNKFLKKMMEYAYAVLENKRGKSIFFNFLTNITPLCDCCNHSDTPIVPDIGILCGTDPVALDQASADLLNASHGISNSVLKGNAILPGEDKLKAIHPKINWEFQLEYAEKISLGKRNYQLQWVS